MVTNAIATKEVAERIGAFLDDYIRLPDGSQIPRNIPYFKEGIQLILSEGASEREIQRRCLESQRQIIPKFLFEKEKSQ